MSRQTTINSFFNKAPKRIESQKKSVAEENLNEEGKLADKENAESSNESQVRNIETKNGLSSCRECKQERRIQGQGLCRSCYWHFIAKPKKEQKEGGKIKMKDGFKSFRVCKSCDKFKKHEGRGFCHACYQRVVTTPKRKTEEYKQANLVMCKNCGEHKTHQAKGMCRKCYRRIFMNPKAVAKRKTDEWKLNHQMMCAECGEIKLYGGKGMCRQCYMKEYHQNVVKARIQSKKQKKQKEEGKAKTTNFLTGPNTQKDQPSSIKKSKTECIDLSSDNDEN